MAYKTGLDKCKITVDDELYAILDHGDEIELVLSIGKHRIRIAAYDLAGNTAEKKYSVRVVENVEEEETQDVTGTPYPEEEIVETPPTEKTEPKLIPEGFMADLHA